jgi:hypothetical protein
VSILTIPPLGPALLKGCLMREGMLAQTFDFNLEFQLNFPKKYQTEIIAWMTTPEMTVNLDHFNVYQEFLKECASKVLSCNPTSVGISVFSHESQRFAEDLCYHIRLCQQEIFIVVGGSGVIVNQNFYGKSWAELAIDSGLVDCVLIGEGELMIANIIKNQSRGIIKTSQLDKEELADLPVPNFTDYNLDAYGPRENLQLPITASKGCVRSCTFCDVANLWPKFRYRRGENVATEMIEIYQSYGIKKFAFTDSLINGGLKPFREMNAVLSKRLPKTISYSGQFICRSQRDMPEDDFYLMRNGGCSRVSIGIESGSESVRNHMKKQFSNRDLHYTVNELLKNDIQQVWNIIVGYPTETEQDWQETLDLIYQYRNHNHLIKIAPIGVFQMLQNTPMTEPQMLSELDIEMHIVNGYSEYGWVSSKNPKNNLRQRANNWKQLVSMLKDLDMASFATNIDQRTMVIEQQVEYYEKKSDKPVFEIRQQSIQIPTSLDCQ